LRFEQQPLIPPQRPLRVEAKSPVLVVGQMSERLGQFAVGGLERLLRKFLGDPAGQAGIECERMLRLGGCSGPKRFRGWTERRQRSARDK
jgi:hypothetical protein